MKILLKFGAALVLFGLLLSALGVGIIRSHAVKPAPATASATVPATATGSAATPASSPASP